MLLGSIFKPLLPRILQVHRIHPIHCFHRLPPADSPRRPSPKNVQLSRKYGKHNSLFSARYGSRPENDRSLSYNARPISFTKTKAAYSTHPEEYLEDFDGGTVDISSFMGSMDTEWNSQRSQGRPSKVIRHGDETSASNHSPNWKPFLLRKSTLLWAMTVHF